jgi:hypothetical protein
MLEWEFIFDRTLDEQIAEHNVTELQRLSRSGLRFG